MRTVAPIFTFTSTPYARDDAPLGGLIPDKRYPHQDALSVVRLEEGTDYSVRTDKNFLERMHIGSKSSFRATIMSLFSASANVEINNDARLSSAEGRIYELRKPKDLFSQLCAREDVQRWLEDGHIGRQETYFIIGYRTFLDGKLVHQIHSSNTSAEVQTPKLGCSVPGGGLHAGVSAELERTAMNDGEFEMVGERIYAICYRKVSFKLFKATGRASLETGNYWRPFFKRSQGPGNITMIEANIEDGDEGEGDSTSEKFTTDDSEEIFVSLSSEV